jgi:hypothetical protein
LEVEVEEIASTTQALLDWSHRVAPATLLEVMVVVGGLPIQAFKLLALP